MLWGAAVSWVINNWMLCEAVILLKSGSSRVSVAISPNDCQGCAPCLQLFSDTKSNSPRKMERRRN